MILFLAFFCSPAFAFNPDHATVKVESYFQKGSENKLEGSGFLIYYGGWKVVTSDHVVLPGNDPVVHKVTTGEGYVMDAVWVKSDWDKGLALLSIVKKHPNISTDYYPDLEHIQQYERAYMSGGPDSRLVGPVTSYGVPSGTSGVRASKGEHIGFVKEGQVLAKQDVLSIKGLNTEFGMSGGPVFYGTGTSFLGLMTHITFEENPQTFVIPGYEVLNWITGYYVSNPAFSRTVEDLQYQFFSKSHAERVHFKYSDITIEKLGKFILVNLPANFYGLNGGQTFPALDHLVSGMVDKGVRVAKIRGSEEYSLGQFIGTLKNNYYIGWEDNEGAVNAGTDGLTSVPNFVGRGAQAVRYSAKRVSLRTKMVSDTFGGPIHAATVKEESQGWIRYSFDNQGPSGIQVQRCFKGDVNCQSIETIDGPRSLASSDWWRNKSSACESQGGTLEVVTVPAGKYRACKMVEDGDTTWYGPVPIYGIIKYQLRGGSTGELESVQYAR